jgi:hypothetical protein
MSSVSSVSSVGSRDCRFEPTPITRRVKVTGDLFHGQVPDGAVYVGRAATWAQASGSVRGRDFWCLDFLPTDHASHGLCDVRTFPFGFLDIKAPPGDPAIADAHDYHPAFLQRGSVLLGAAPDPFAPLLLSNDGEAEELGAEVRDALVDLRPILPDLFASAEGSRWMGGLLTSVSLIEAGKVSLQVMGIHGFHKALAGRFATRLRDIAHLVPPVRSAARAMPHLNPTPTRVGRQVISEVWLRCARLQ